MIYHSNKPMATNVQDDDYHGNFHKSTNPSELPKQPTYEQNIQEMRYFRDINRHDIDTYMFSYFYINNWLVGALRLKIWQVAINVL